MNDDALPSYGRKTEAETMDAVHVQTRNANHKRFRIWWWWWWLLRLENIVIVIIIMLAVYIVTNRRFRG
jgi:hypothetical protein